MTTENPPFTNVSFTNDRTRLFCSGISQWPTMFDHIGGYELRFLTARHSGDGKNLRRQHHLESLLVLDLGDVAVESCVLKK